MLYFVILALGLVSCAVFLTKRAPKVTISVTILKALTSVLFILTAISAFLSNPKCPTPLALFMIAGAVFGMLGDIWLDLKYVYPADSKTLLNAGFTSFLIGHVFYSVALACTYELKWYHFVIGVVGGIVVALFTCFSESLLGVFYGESKKITAVYMAVLGFTLFFSTAFMFTEHFTLSAILTNVGMVLFIASDAVLSGIYFGEGKNTKFNVVLNHSLYYAAQFIIASSLYFAK